MSEKRLSTRREKVLKVAEVLATGGFSLLDTRRSPVIGLEAAPERLTDEVIRQQTGFKIVEQFPHWQTNAADIVEFHDELVRIGTDLGWDKVIGSTYQDSETGELKLGVFVQESAIPSGSGD